MGIFLIEKSPQKDCHLTKEIQLFKTFDKSEKVEENDVLFLKRKNVRLFKYEGLVNTTALSAFFKVLKILKLAL